MILGAPTLADQQGALLFAAYPVVIFGVVVIAGKLLLRTGDFPKLQGGQQEI